jgi:exodeoxyribonuclease III
MRLTTWNCNGAFHAKQSAVLALGPDVLIVPECAQHSSAQPELGQNPATGSDWIGHRENKGLGVFSFGSYSISCASFHNTSHRLILPLEVSGPLPFLLLAVWTLPDEGGSYVRPLVEAWREYLPQLKGRDVVIAGDFNASVIFPGKPNYHFSVFLEDVEQSGVRSLYHHFFNEPYGEEAFPTFFMYRHETRPFHIDYVFASDGMRLRMKSFAVGKHSEWSVHSDHMPLTTEF